MAKGSNAAKSLTALLGLVASLVFVVTPNQAVASVRSTPSAADKAYAKLVGDLIPKFSQALTVWSKVHKRLRSGHRYY
jgi:hypothetical protein